MKNIYNYVAVIGIDGMGNFNRSADTPCMDRIFANGAYTYNAMSMDPTISAENWGGMLLGALPAVHGLTNGYISAHPYTDEGLPSVFKRIRNAYPDSYLASAVNWEPINIGIVEDGIGVDKRTADNDALVTQAAIECIKQKPKFLFVQLDEVDGAGHHFGYGTEDYIKKIGETDALVGRMYDEYVRQGIADETLFICIADHGGNSHSHGGWSVGEKYVFLAAAGRYVTPGEIEYAVTKDISAIVLTALGIDVPEYCESGFSSQVPALICEGAPGYRIPAEKPPVAHEASPGFKAPGGLGDLFGDKLRLCMYFDNDSADETGGCSVSETGSVKFYSNGVRGETAEFGATGSYSVGGLSFDKSFTLAFWLLADSDLPEPAYVLGNKSAEDRRDKGFAVFLRNHSLMTVIGCGDDDTDSVTAFGADGFSGWIHVILSFDYEKNEVRCSFDFKAEHTEITEKRFIDSVSCGSVFTIGDDAGSEFNRKRGLIFRIDDLLVFDGADDGVISSKLKEYYSRKAVIC